MSTPANDRPKNELTTAQRAILGEQLAVFEDVDAKEGRAWGCLIVGVIVAIAIIAINLLQNIGWWFYLLMLPPALVAFVAAEKRRRTVVQVFDGGVVTWGQRVSPSVMTWEEIAYGETQWSDTEFEIYLGYRNGQPGGAYLGSKMFKRRKQEFRAILFRAAYPTLRSLWAKAIRDDQPFEYEQVAIRQDGIFFRKAQKLLRWEDLESYSVGGEWQIYFNLPDGTNLRPGLNTYELPWAPLLFQVAEEVKQVGGQG